MEHFYDAIYLSPHFDDVALSCGGQVYDLVQTGKKVLIVTVMGGRPLSLSPSQYVDSLHDRWQLEQDAVAVRQTEDIAACNVLGADWQHWDFLDCIYRVEAETNRPLYSSDAEIFGQIDPAENKLAAQIGEKIAGLPPTSQLYLPLTLGQHVDHQLTRLAAEQERPFTSLLYYEDYPYAGQYSAEQYTTQQPGSWQSWIVSPSKNGIKARLKAISCFKSQLSTFFKDESDLKEQVMGFIDSVGGERLWIRK
jgi:LmbE family N-acetylglucosaminyl deacetylase